MAPLLPNRLYRLAPSVAITCGLPLNISCAFVAAREYLLFGGPQARQDIQSGLHTPRLLVGVSDTVS